MCSEPIPGNIRHSSWSFPQGIENYSRSLQNPFFRNKGHEMVRLVQTFCSSCRHEKRARDDHVGSSFGSIEGSSITLRRKDASRRFDRDSRTMLAIVDVNDIFIINMRNRSFVVRRTDLTWKIVPTFLGGREHI